MTCNVHVCMLLLHFRIDNVHTSLAQLPAVSGAMSSGAFLGCLDELEIVLSWSTTSPSFLESRSCLSLGLLARFLSIIKLGFGS